MHTLVAGTFMATLSVCSLANAAVDIKLAHNGNTNPDDPQNVGVDAFKKMVEERSDGEINVQIYPAGQLGDARAIVEGVQLGMIEMGDVENGPMGGFVPEAMLWDLPFIFRDIDHAHNVLDGEIGSMVQEKYLDAGIRHLAYNDGGFRYFTNDERPIRSMEDLEGLKIRVMESEVMVDTLNAFGASAVPMSFGELYTALQQGVVDGQENPMNLINSQRFYEVQDYLSLSGHFYYPRQYIAGEAWWSTLDAEHQEIISKAALEASAIQREALADYQVEMRKALEGHGMEINEVEKDAFIEAALEKIYPSYYEVLGSGDPERGEELISNIMATE
ncbi:C4-dicarboxylate ABC transporter substrate-binding protein [Halomonas urumqiensis]|uniref:C4-dicarboxylate ABC transporter substrate-binding protein n=2 Tax=Halomonas urumqiensis TaxID=1684789 RepID=A0A2N7UMR6_9GAMM|nr:C4-dicarboxylate ABC transporter substrate-binding protein [Halomonas urumqiensis]PTB02450.1 C4-dicarboxylate ABC transporter substrate-binding protein [Halomonas urumqiensis]